MTVVLGEMDVSRVKPKPTWPAPPPPPVHEAWFAPHRSAAVTNFLGRVEVRLFPGGRRPPATDNRGHQGKVDKAWREAKEGSFDSPSTAQRLFGTQCAGIMSSKHHRGSTSIGRYSAH